MSLKPFIPIEGDPSFGKGRKKKLRRFKLPKKLTTYQKIRKWGERKWRNWYKQKNLRIF